MSVPTGIRSEGVRIGAEALVRVPGSSANLGPGFDSLGLALAVHDDVRLTILPEGLDVEVSGEGEGIVPSDEKHLLVRAVRATFDAAGVEQPGLRLRCDNSIPHGRGLGSSAAAVVAGVVAARACLSEPDRLDDDDVLTIATSFEGHPDNAAASLYGGFTVAWMDDSSGVGAPLSAGASPAGETVRPRAVCLRVHPDVLPLVCVPQADLPTERARAMLPATVPHGDAAFNAGRSALLVEALTRRPRMLFAATEDRLHQRQRAEAMPEGAALLAACRAAGLPAVVSGAGPSILVLATIDSDGERVLADLLASGVHPGWRVLRAGVDTLGARVVTEGDSRL